MIAKVCIKDSPQHGRGVFAALPLAAGEEIMVFGGLQLHRSQVDFNDYHLQIGADLYLGPSGAADDYVNHSCAPNAAFNDGLSLVALCDIAAGAEITWDYSTAIDEADFPGFPCSCGAAGCRKSVQSYRHLGRDDQRRLAPYLLPYLKASVPS